jgi:hypothetical protein
MMLEVVGVVLVMVCAVVLTIRHDRNERHRLADEHHHDMALLAELDRLEQ